MNSTVYRLAAAALVAGLAACTAPSEEGPQALSSGIGTTSNVGQTGDNGGPPLGGTYRIGTRSGSLSVSDASQGAVALAPTYENAPEQHFAFSASEGLIHAGDPTVCVDTDSDAIANYPDAPLRVRRCEQAVARWVYDSAYFTLKDKVTGRCVVTSAKGIAMGACEPRHVAMIESAYQPATTTIANPSHLLAQAGWIRVGASAGDDVSTSYDNQGGDRGRFTMSQGKLRSGDLCVDTLASDPEHAPLRTVRCADARALWSLDAQGRLYDWETGRCAEVEHRWSPSDLSTRPMHIARCKDRNEDQQVLIKR